jgi:DNA-directed RNA polymerase specialized sigma24 family protein
MSHAEIAKVVDQPLGSVKARIHRAKLKLSKWLQDNDHSIQTQTKNQFPKGKEHHA